MYVGENGLGFRVDLIPPSTTVDEENLAPPDI